MTMEWKKKSVEEGKNVARETIAFVNNISRDDSGYVEEVINSHRTLQQAWMRLACKTIKAIADQKNYDARNEASVKLAKSICEVDGFDCLPFI